MNITNEAYVCEERKNIVLCPLSGEKMQLRFSIPRDWRRPQIERDFQLYWCDRSQFGCIYPTPTPQEVQEFYALDNYYTHTQKSQGSKSHSTQNFWERLLVRLAWQFDREVAVVSDRDWFSKQFGSQPRSICEIGCGSGHHLQALQSYGHRVCGVEPDLQAYIVAGQRNLPIFHGSAESLPEPIQSQRYDVVLMNHVLEHTLDPIQAVRNALQLLAPGGKLVLETPNNASQSFQLAGPTWFHLDVPRHLYFFTPHSLRLTCEKAGATILRTEFRGYCRQFKSSWIETEQKIWEIFEDCGNSPRGLPQKNSMLKAWFLLLRTVFAAKERKYDSVRVTVERSMMK